MAWDLSKNKPITSRFTAYSDEDRRADDLWDKYKQVERYESHGGAHLHEMPPHVQRMVYDFARALQLNYLGIAVKDVRELPYSGGR